MHTTATSFFHLILVEALMTSIRWIVLGTLAVLLLAACGPTTYGWERGRPDFKTDFDAIRTDPSTIVARVVEEPEPTVGAGDELPVDEGDDAPTAPVGDDDGTPPGDDDNGTPPGDDDNGTPPGDDDDDFFVNLCTDAALEFGIGDETTQWNVVSEPSRGDQALNCQRSGGPNMILTLIDADGGWSINNVTAQ